ncbi:MAG: hypothetical protein LBB41_00270, partial [Prevotellaceae bacterium]|nr:hypothetical protein [Prevotellaceae bacterium]
KKNYIGNVLVACEYSGRVRDAFENAGWNAWSCDILPTESEQTKRAGKHSQNDVFEFLNWCNKNNYDIPFDMLIAFPPCTYLTFAGHAPLLWYDVDRVMKRIAAAQFFMELWNLPISHICIENPRGVMSNIYRAPDQYIHPYYFGERQMKRTGLWLKNLPKLKYTLDNNLFGEKVTATPKPQPIIKTMIKKTGRLKNRYFSDACDAANNKLLRDENGKLKFKTGHEKSLTFQCIADAMAEQWTEYFINNPLKK